VDLKIYLEIVYKTELHFHYDNATSTVSISSVVTNMGISLINNERILIDFDFHGSKKGYRKKVW